MNKITVIVPVYNVEFYLCRCIDSILSQTFTDFELILVDDGSTDRSSAICDKYAQKDNRIVVIHKINGGVSSARNVALDIAKGEYITFCDSDDYYYKDWLESLYICIQSEHADLVMGNYFTVDELGKVLSKSKKKAGKWNLSELNNRDEYFVNNILYDGNGWEVWSALFRKKIIDLNSIHFCETCGNYAEDLAFILDFVLYCSVTCCIEKTGYCYVLRKGSMMHSSHTKVKFNELNEVSNFFGNHYLQIYSSYSKKLDYSILHFLILYTEYVRVIYGLNGSNFALLPFECKRIQNKQWFNQNQRRLIFRIGKLRKITREKNNKDLIMIARYSVHQVPILFQIESAIYYKVNEIIHSI